MRHKLRVAAGIFLLVLAVLGWFLPLMPGWPFFFAAVALLGTDHPIVQWFYKRMHSAREELKKRGLWKGDDGPPTV